MSVPFKSPLAVDLRRLNELTNRSVFVMFEMNVHGTHVLFKILALLCPMAKSVILKFRQRTRNMIRTLE
jgi:hypothetical protein